MIELPTWFITAVAFGNINNVALEWELDQHQTTKGMVTTQISVDYPETPSTKPILMMWSRKSDDVITKMEVFHKLKIACGTWHTCKVLKIWISGLEKTGVGKFTFVPDLNNCKNWRHCYMTKRSNMFTLGTF